MTNAASNTPIRTFDYGGVPVVRMSFIGAASGQELADTLMRAFATNHPALVHPESPQLLDT